MDEHDHLRISAAMTGLGVAAGELAKSVGEWADALDKANASAKEFQQTPYFRRMNRERILGYRLPDWVWNVEEKMRRTEGSGNGRIMRD